MIDVFMSLIMFLFGIIVGILLLHSMDELYKYYMNKYLLRSISNDEVFHDAVVSLIQKEIQK